MTAHVKTPLLPAADETSAVMFDYRLVRDWLRYALHSVSRHPAIAIMSLVVIAGGSFVAAVQLPRHYEAKTRLLSNHGLLSAPNPYGGAPDDLPAIAARERIMARDSLEKIVEQVGLVASWKTSRTPLFALKDKLQQTISGTWTEEDLTDIMIGTLEKKMKVKAEKGTIEISVEWPEPFVARQIVEAATQNFLETRHVNEVATKSEAIGVLEGYRKQLDKEIEEAFGNLKRVSDERTRTLRASVQANAPAAPPLPKGPSEADLKKADDQASEVAALKSQLRTRQRAIQDLEDWRTRSVSDLRTQLEQQRLTYRPTHPVIQQLEQRLNSVERDSPQMVALRREESQLTKQIESRGGGAQPQTSDFLLMDARRFPFPFASALDPNNNPRDALERELARDPAMMVAQDALRVALGRAQELRARLDASRIELDSSRASYKYSFSIVAPAQTPRKPEWPNVPVLIFVGILTGLLFAFVACTALDLWRGKVVEEWQINRSLRMPILSSVRL